MHGFTAHRLRFAAEVVSPTELNDYVASALRAAFFHALMQSFCANHPALSNGGCSDCIQRLFDASIQPLAVDT